MNYQKHYDLLISTRQPLNRKKGDGQHYDKHHIVPRSLGGDNSKENLLLLTPKEHFIAHFLLWRIHRNRSMAAAFFSMCNGKLKKAHGKQYHNPSSRAYAEAVEAVRSIPMPEEIRKKHSLIPWNKGVKYTEEQRKNMKGKTGETDAQRKKRGEALKKVYQTVSPANSIKIVIHGIEYRGINTAAKALGISRRQIYKLLHSNTESCVIIEGSTNWKP